MLELDGVLNEVESVISSMSVRVWGTSNVFSVSYSGAQQYGWVPSGFAGFSSQSIKESRKKEISNKFWLSKKKIQERTRKPK